MTEKEFQEAANERAARIFASRKTGSPAFGMLDAGIGRYIEKARNTMYKKDGRRRVEFLGDRRSETQLAYEIALQDAVDNGLEIPEATRKKYPHIKNQSQDCEEQVLGI